MKIRWTLLRFYWSRTRLVTAVPAVAAALYVLFAGEWLRRRDSWPWVFIVAHSALLTWRVGSPPRGERSFLYSRGFRRDVLWAHGLLAAFLAALVVWLPASLIIWTGLRSRVQDAMENPYFPLMAPVETSLPWLWLAAYAALIAVLPYAWIRAAQPARGQSGGAYLTAWLVLCGFMVAAQRSPETWLRAATLALGIGLVLTALLIGRRMHREIETGG